MFKDVNSKVKKGINEFKTSNHKDNLDNLIQKVENEIKELDGDEN